MRSETASIAVVQQGGPQQELAIWGPMSVEIPSADKKLIRMSAVQRALPSLFRRGLSMMHSDTMVGSVPELLKVDPERLPIDPVLRMMVDELIGQYGGLPSAVIPVTRAIAAVFPKQLSGLIGQPVAFAAGVVYEDDRIGKITRDEVLAGRIDSYSIAGASFKSRPISYCDANGCTRVDEVLDLDLSMLTLCTSDGTKTPFGAAKAQNSGAAFVIVQQASKCDCATVSTKHVKGMCELNLEGSIKQAEATSHASINFQGLPLVIENGKGTIRRGPGWETTMLANYGRIEKTEGADGDEVDCYVSDNLAADFVLVVHQVKPDGSFDEHKCVLGCTDADAALAVYKAHYPTDFKVGPVKGMSMLEFKDWLENGDMTLMAQAKKLGEQLQEAVIACDKDRVQALLPQVRETLDTVEEGYGARLAKGVASTYVKGIVECSTCKLAECSCMKQAEGDVTTATPGLENPMFGGGCKCGGKECKCSVKKLEQSTSGVVINHNAQDSVGASNMPEPTPPTTPPAEPIAAPAAPEPVAQAATPEVIVLTSTTTTGTASTVITTGTVIQQAAPDKKEEPEPEMKKEKEAEEPEEEKAMETDLVRRVEALEQEVALLKGQRTEAPAEGEQEAMYQAAIKQALDAALPGAVAAALKTLAPLEPVKQAKQVIETPIPASPTIPVMNSDPEVGKLQQALDSQGPSGFRDVLAHFLGKSKE